MKFIPSSLLIPWVCFARCLDLWRQLVKYIVLSVSGDIRKYSIWPIKQKNEENEEPGSLVLNDIVRHQNQSMSHFKTAKRGKSNSRDSKTKPLSINSVKIISDFQVLVWRKETLTNHASGIGKQKRFSAGIPFILF